MELVSLWNLGENASEFKKFKYYLFKTFISFSKLNWNFISFIWKFTRNALSLFFTTPNLYMKISPYEKVIVNKNFSYNWTRNLY
jgi:hypothetical protein